MSGLSWVTSRLVAARATAIDFIMEKSTFNFGQLGMTSKNLAQRLFTIGENRLELLTVEMQEERERLLHAILLAFGVAVFGLLAGIMLAATIVVLLWAYSPVAVLLTMTGVFGLAGIFLCRRLTGLLHNWQMLSASLDQLRKDRVCLEKILA